MAEFVILFMVNLSLILWIIRWRGVTSCEGLGMVFVALAVASDGFGLIGASLFDSVGTQAIERMQLEVIPTIIHIVGILCLVLGLAITNLRATPIQCQLTKHDRSNLAFLGWITMATGLCMKILALHLAGIGNVFAYLDQLYDYDISVRKYGFLDQGVGIAVFGILLVVTSYEWNNRFKQCLLLASAFIISVSLSTSKSGIIQIMIPFYLLTRGINVKTLHYWSRWPILAIVAFVFVVGLGIKSQVKYGGFAGVEYSTHRIVDVAKTTILLRFSSSGLYEGYSNLVNRVIEDPSNLFRGRIVMDGVVLGNIPRFVFNDLFLMEKPDHPFHAMGALVNKDYVVDPYGNDASTLVGFAFADFGFWSLIIYMTLGGMVLGLTRRFSMSIHKNVIFFIGYILFVSYFAISLAETGFLSVFYYVTLAALFVVAAFFLINIRKMLHVLVKNNRRQFSCAKRPM